MILKLSSSACHYVCHQSIALRHLRLFAQVSASGKMTLADRYGILAVLLHAPTNEEELYCIDRILHSVRQGRVQMVNEFSTIR